MFKSKSVEDEMERLDKTMSAVVVPRILATPTSQQRKNNSHDSSNRNSNDKTNPVVKKEKLSLLQCRRYFSDFTKSLQTWQLDDREWNLLRKTPFGSLMEGILKIDINVEMLDALLSFWDEEHCGFVIGKRTIPFTVDDIALITGLPNRGCKIIKHKVLALNHPELSRSHMAIKDIEQNLDRLLKTCRNSPNSETDNQFVQQMILFLFGCVLFPPHSRIVPQYLSHCVKSLETIGSYNWAELLHSVLVKEINAQSKLLKVRNEGKNIAVAHISGLFFAINVWLFEHVDFGKDMRPSNPEQKPRMLKWVGCKSWQRNQFLQRFAEIVEDKVSYHIIPKPEELAFVSPNNVHQMACQTFDDFAGAVRDDPSQLRTSGNNKSDINVGYDGTYQRGREVGEEKKGKKSGKDEYFDITRLADLLYEHKELISVLERKIANLQRLAASKGWEIEEMNDVDSLGEHKDGEVDEEEHNGKIVREVNKQSREFNEAYHESCIEEDKGLTVERVGQPSIFEIGIKKGCRKLTKRKDFKRVSEKKNILLKWGMDVEKVQTSIPISTSFTNFKRKGADILVNLDDYASPIQKKMTIVVPLNYVGRELLSEKERTYLDDFCIKPMQREDIVFFNWNISIRRHSMVKFLQGGYTSEEIIDAYTRILFKRDKVANFLYVPPMFLGLYRNKLFSYKTFLESVDKKSLGRVKFVLLPLLISTANHWLLVVYNMEIQRWTIYDSLYDPRHRGGAKGQIMLFEEYLYQDHGFDIRSSNVEYQRIYPQQEPGTLDCGIFVMKFIESIIQDSRTINFQGTDMQLFRPQIAYTILCHC